MARAYKHKNNFKEAKDCLETALNKISLLDIDIKRELESTIYTELADIYITKYLNRKEAREAEKYALKSLEILNASELLSNNPKQEQEKISCCCKE
jgi:tetratricopeptide (TPR) repeat protein